jgi:PAS domain S-box-containing protein
VTQGEPEAAARAGAIDHQRAFVVLRAAQRALLRAEDEAELLRSICRIAVEEAGYRLAWVGLAEDGEERPVRPVAQAGYEEGYLESVTISWADTPLGRGPTGTAIRTGRPVVGRNFLTDPELAPWRDHAIERGFLSSVALPLQAHDRTFGALTIYAAEPDAFSPQDVDLLTGLADDLSFGIMTLRSRNAAYEALRRSEHNLAEAQRIAHIGSWEWNLETGAALRSDELYRIYGVEPGAIAETTEAFLAFVHPGDLTRVQASERAAATGNSDHDLDYRIITADGAVRTVHEQGEVTRDEHGRPVRLIGTVEDITERVAADAERFRLALAVEQTADAVWMQNADGTVTFVNRAFSRMYGYEPGEIVGRTAGHRRQWPPGACRVR